MLSQDIEDLYSEIMGEKKAWVPMIWPQQCGDSDEGMMVGKPDWKSYGTQSCRTENDNDQITCMHKMMHKCTRR